MASHGWRVTGNTEVTILGLQTSPKVRIPRSAYPTIATDPNGKNKGAVCAIPGLKIETRGTPFSCWADEIRSRFVLSRV